MCHAKTKLLELSIVMFKSKFYRLILGFLILISMQTYGQVNTCGNEQSNHPVDKRIIEIRDSLQKTGIDTILIYSHWLYTGSFNGYGKAIWKNQGICYQLKIPFHNGDELYGLGQQELKILENDSIIDFFFLNRIDTISVFRGSLSYIQTGSSIPHLSISPSAPQRAIEFGMKVESNGPSVMYTGVSFLISSSP